MRKRSLALTISVLLCFVTGCAEERIPADEAELWEAAENPASTPSPGGNSSAGSAGENARHQAAADGNQAAASDGAGTIVNGSELKIEGENASAEGHTFMRAHYFEAFAPLELTAPATTMETSIEGQNANGAVPVIGLFVMGEDGKTYFSNRARPIDGKQLLKDNVNLAPGKYQIRITYFNDTVGEIRPRMNLETIRFH